MIQIVKGDFYLNRFFIVFIIVFIPLIYIMNTDPLYIYGGVTLGLIFNVFYYENKNHVNRFITSLPVNKRVIVLGRYLFLITIILGILLYQWLIDAIAHNGLPYLDAAPITSASIGLIFVSISVAISIVLPILYLFKSFMKAILFIFILLSMVTLSLAIMSAFITFPPFIMEIMNRKPLLISVIFALICFYGSFRLSAWIFMKKDIIY